MSSIFNLGAAMLAFAALTIGCTRPTPLAPSRASNGSFRGLAHERIGPIPNYHPARQQPDRGRSWMAAGANSIKALLYISDHHTDDVYVYNYKTGELVGKLTGFHDPYGQCVDATGNVWIVNYSGSTVVEYAHGGMKPIKSLATDGASIGCTVDYLNNLYVANITTPSGPGDLQVWMNESGTPTDYSNAGACYYLWPPGFGSDAGLVVETAATSYACELLNSLRADNTVFGNFTIGFPGGTMWDGTYTTLSDQEYGGNHATALDQTVLEVSGGLNLVGQTILRDTCHGTDVDVIQPFIVGNANTPVNGKQGTIVVGGNLSCKSRFDYWAYPSGGNPVKTLKAAPLEPYGASVSLST